MHALLMHALQPPAAPLWVTPKRFAERHHEAIFEAFRLEFYLRLSHRRDQQRAKALVFWWLYRGPVTLDPGEAQHGLSVRLLSPPLDVDAPLRARERAVLDGVGCKLVHDECKGLAKASPKNQVLSEGRGALAEARKLRFEQGANRNATLRSGRDVFLRVRQRMQAPDERLKTRTSLQCRACDRLNDSQQILGSVLQFANEQNLPCVRFLPLCHISCHGMDHQRRPLCIEDQSGIDT